MTCEACNTIPPVIAVGYEPKGKWEELGGLKTCSWFCFFLSSFITDAIECISLVGMDAMLLCSPILWFSNQHGKEGRS